MTDSIELFGRRCEVVIGPPGQQGKKWTDLRVTFSVEKGASPTPNKVELALYNLSRASRDYIRAGMVVEVYAGYETEFGLIASGDIAKGFPVHSREGENWVTRIEAADGGRAWGTVLHESFGPKTRESEIVRALAERLGVKLGKIEGLSDIQVGKGRQLTGPARNELESLCRSRGLRWSIQDGVLHILPRGTPTNAGSAILLNASSGLIGSPERTESGCDVTTLLRGWVNPKTLIRVESKVLTGNFIAERVTHSGDTHGTDWYTKIEAKHA